jgi:hypothetical protein
MTRYSLPAVLALTAIVAAHALASRQSLQQAIDIATPSFASQHFSCLPKDVRGDETLSYGLKGAHPVTVKQKLLELKARCRKGKLVDAKAREIRFFRLACWGNPPPDYLEVEARENRELRKLQKRFTVLVFTCNPMIQ